MAWTKRITVLCAVLMCTAAVSADQGFTMRAAIMNDRGEMLPQATLVAEGAAGEPIRAAAVGNGRWFIAGAAEKTMLHLEHPERGAVNLEVSLPPGLAQVDVYWADKTAHAIVTEMAPPTPERLAVTPHASPEPYLQGRLDGSCPPDSLYGQTAHMPDDGWSAGTSEFDVDGANLLRADKFVGASGEVCDLHWYGFMLYLGADWANCVDSDPAFEIKFFEDAGSAPGAELCRYTVYPTITGTGLLYHSIYQFELQYFEVPTLDPCCQVPANGWVSIQGLGDASCWFLWISSPDGDGSSYFNNNGTPEAYGYDNAFCLTGTYVPVYGACCDDSTATCTDNVEQMDCLPPMRFAANTLCGDLDPACGEITTCEHSIVLTDDYGDGWNGGSVTVLVNGSVVLSGITLASGAGPETYYFQAATGDLITTSYVEGSWGYENEYHIYDVNGAEICADGTGGTTPTGCSTFGNCGADPCEGNEPANDECVDATPVNAPYPQTINGTNYCASIDCPGVLDWNATWYEIELPNALNNVNISFCGNGFEINNIGIVVYDDCFDCAAYIVADQYEWYSCPDAVVSPILDWFELPGPATVLFPVYYNGGEAGDYMFEVNVTGVVVPDNDLCADAIAVGVPSVTPGSTQGASIDSAFPTCGTSITSPGVWYSVTGTGTTMTASLCNGVATYDTKISVYCPDCDEAICVDGNDDFCGLQSEISWCSQLGANYLILVHGYGGATGPFELEVYEDGAPCSADVACLPEGACCLPTGECVIINEAACIAMGGGYQGDDTNCLGLPAADATVTVEILTDNYGSETSWELVDGDGNVVAEGGSLLSNTLYSWDVPVMACGCYTFTIFDSFGDGICCSYGNGYYNVYFEGSLVATGGDFGDDESVANIGDCTGCAGGTGACCLPDQSCLITTAECCAYAGGTYVGDGTNCGTGTVVVFSEDFNAGIPGDWWVTDDDGSGLVWTTNDLLGDNNWTGGTGLCAEASSDTFGSASYDTSLISPNLDLSGVASATLEFTANFQNFAGYDFFEVYVSYDKGVTWTLLLSWNEDHGTFHGTPGEFVSLPIAGGSMDTQIRFRYYDPVVHYNWEIQVDDVMITAEVQGLSPCQSMDIKPGSCPNSFNRKSHGVLPVGLAGTVDFDVTMVDIASLTLERADGVGGAVAPHEGPPGPKTKLADVATPFDGIPCECHEFEGDGILDVSMKFKTDLVVPTLEMDGLPGGALVPLVLRGTLLDGTPFVATDCVRLVPPGTPPGQVNLRSNVSGVWVDISPLDLQLDGGGFCDYDRTYPIGTQVTLVAQQPQFGKTFLSWRVDGAVVSTDPVLQITVTENMPEIRAIYGFSKAPVAPMRLNTLERPGGIQY